jgi:hypothetical protein
MFIVFSDTLQYFAALVVAFVSGTNGVLFGSFIAQLD